MRYKWYVSHTNGYFAARRSYFIGMVSFKRTKWHTNHVISPLLLVRWTSGHDVWKPVIRSLPFVLPGVHITDIDWDLAPNGVTKRNNQYSSVSWHRLVPYLSQYRWYGPPGKTYGKLCITRFHMYYPEVHWTNSHGDTLWRKCMQWHHQSESYLR